MDSIRIEGGTALKGEIEISPAKNAVLPLMAAALLAEGESTLLKVPRLADVATLSKLLRHLGLSVEEKGGGLSLSNSGLASAEAPYDLVKTMRASVLVLGPMVGRYGKAVVSLPGGCAIGARPIDQHLKGLERMGAKVLLSHGYVTVTAKKLKGCRFVFDLVTVTGTENILMAACLAEGTTVIENAAREPEVTDLAECLVSMGAKISGIGSDVLTVEGVDSLSPYSYRPVPDRIETGTFMAAAAITGGELLLKEARLEHLDAVVGKLKEAGTDIAQTPEGVLVRSTGKIKSVDIRTNPHPAFPTDMQAQFMALMALGDTVSSITESIFDNRYMHAAELVRMGADIRIVDSTATVRGVKSLSGANVMATDLRASAALVIAGLAATGTTNVSRVYHLDRGYEHIEEKLGRVGAKIMRVRE